MYKHLLYVLRAIILLIQSANTNQGLRCAGSDHLDYIGLRERALFDRLIEVPLRVMRAIREQLLNAGTTWVPWGHGQDISRECYQAIVDGMYTIELNFVIMLPPTEYITYAQDRQSCYVRFAKMMSGDHETRFAHFNPLMLRERKLSFRSA